MLRKYLPRKVKRWLTVQKVKDYTFICNCGKIFDGKQFIKFLRHQRNNNHVNLVKVETKLVITPLDNQIKELKKAIGGIELIDLKSTILVDMKGDLEGMRNEREIWISKNF